MQMFYLFTQFFHVSQNRKCEQFSDQECINNESLLEASFSKKKTFVKSWNDVKRSKIELEKKQAYNF